MVKNAWSCSTSEASPAGMPSLIAVNRKPELADADDRPVGDRACHSATCGRLTKKIAGSAATT